MNCKQGTEIIVNQIIDLLNRIEPDIYSKPLPLFNGSSIGQHFRHILDFYGCLSKTTLNGRVDYADRLRDTQVETEPVYAAQILEQYIGKINELNEEVIVEVVADFSSDLNETRPVVSSSIGRELMYAYDHAVHHLAIIKMGLKSISPNFQIDKNLGVAPSTVKHWNA